MKIYNVGIIGAGLQAQRRIPAINQVTNSRVVGITSQTLIQAQELAKQYKINVYPHWHDLTRSKDVDIVLVATYPDTHAEITIDALKNGKHVLCEKPLAQTLEQAKKMIQASQRYKKLLKCGFNHRFHPAALEIKKLVENKTFGKLLFGRGIYGHSGRPGFEKEWRTNKQYSAGGILMEQGIHLVDLFRWYFGDFNRIFSVCQTLYFPIAPFEDSAFALLQTRHTQNVSIHTSNLEWKNKFLLELYAQNGYMKMEGIGGSYGTHVLTIGEKADIGPFTEKVFEYRGSDMSWKTEWEEFISAIENNSNSLDDGQDGLEAMRIIFAAYESSKKGRVITL